MSFQVYTIIHLSGAFLVLMTLASLCTHFYQGGTRATLRSRKLYYACNGLGMFLILLGGFGMLARLGIHWPWPLWIVIKFSIWLLLGGVIALIPRFGEHSRMIWIFTFFLAFAAALSAYFKVS